MWTLTDEEVRAIHEKAKVDVTVGCDDNHQHLALQDCLRGDERAIDVCKLAEIILRERRAFRKAMERVGEEK